MRPIHVVTDNDIPPEWVITLPDLITPDAWGKPIVVAHRWEKHYYAKRNLSAY